MAQSPAHKFGQIIGDLLEELIHRPLQTIAAQNNLYLDYKHPRRARNGRTKVSWRDYKGNDHDLDYVLESGGSEDRYGRPTAFIETAWRRYTKHSRNKAQEIQGAIIPLAETYQDCHPFLGICLAGVFTEGSLTQLHSHGFKVLYYPYENVVAAFQKVGINAHFDEDTPDAEIQDKVDAYERLTETEKRRILEQLYNSHREELQRFMDALDVSLNRSIQTIYVVPLHGVPQELSSVPDAISFLQTYRETEASRPFIRYEVNVIYTNGDEIRGQFQDKLEAIKFLNNLK